ncbi:hypothetical protein OQA88_5384 [Cercophora sp. LCS_1]
MPSGYSTLPELSGRAGALEVRRSIPGLQVLRSRRQHSTTAPPIKFKRSDRFWALMSAFAVLAAASIAVSVAGALLTRKTPVPASDDNPDTEKNVVTSNSTRSIALVLIIAADPNFHKPDDINIINRTIAFADDNDNTTSSACNYTVILLADDGNPCREIFVLPDGFEYVWNGCGLNT